MFYIYKINDVVRIPPNKFKDDLKDTIKNLVTEEKVGLVDPNIGVILGVKSVDEVGEASVLLGDGAAYVDTNYSLITYKPEMQEVIETNVKDLAEFGAFLTVGPFDGLVHVSQIMNDFISFESKNMNFAGRDTNKLLGKDDRIIARVISTSLKGNVTMSKIGLTMRQDGLGKDQWVGENNG